MAKIIEKAESFLDRLERSMSEWADKIL